MAPTGTNLYGKHYHPFMDVAAEPLTTFKTPKWLVQGIRDAFQAHRRIAEECGLLHGDISAGNILITQDGRGVLTDWDISGSVNDKDIARRVWQNIELVSSRNF
ncbi:hypothetical protein BJ138DRAFT_1106337 [Hygrophoropsis aurantiaca]|uniref:Uncharacterized protein n=1 Tax=Hygrophoropsis aurantiaca TaxID=72124 RepID=A0ACB7ZWB3_9AGAM|nr:hypothetical protein BJ138DRAFT_1106337 [Hygrophoropsis aurantiaca]